ncbi:hypothetical protein L6452_37568 [Arctium lappa]|uniref:Uncharacterized protein n=1 Tax=Arctium lappa TaxID=4217 RepID=A0ACB8Y2P6_ARCLA|nr:hypothetical protein L6452_37568 [Arctium lappa]
MSSNRPQTPPIFYNKKLSILFLDIYKSSTYSSIILRVYKSEFYPTFIHTNSPVDHPSSVCKLPTTEYCFPTTLFLLTTRRI